MDITETEWDELEEKLSVKICTRWPWLHDGDLRVKTPILSAHAELRLSNDARSRTVKTVVDSSGCVSGGVVEIANAVRMMGDVRDAMLFVYGETSGVVVWRDGDCPCSYCSSRGTTQGRKCERCNGTGKR